MTPFQNLRRNFAKAVMETYAVSALNFAGLMINTNALGVLLFGQLIVIQSLTELFSGIFSFNTWQSLNRFGADDLEKGNYSKLRQRYFFALGLDFLAACTAAICAIVAFLFFIEVFGLDSELRWLGVVYGFSVAFHARSASVGIFRLLERFGIPIMFTVTEAAALAINAAVLWWIDAPLEYYVYSIAFIQVFTSVTLSACGLIMVGRMEKRGGYNEDKSFPKREFLRFAFAVSATGTVGIMLRKGEVLLISMLLGPAAAGLFGVAFRGAYFFARFADAGNVSVYPIIAKMAVSGEVAKAKDIVMRATLPVVGVALVMFTAAILGGRPALEIIFGDEFGAAYPNLLWLAAGTLTNACFFAVIPLIDIVLGATRTFVFSIISFVSFLVASIVGLSVFGLPAGGVGTAAYFATLALLAIWQVRKLPLIKAPANSPVH
ncbi:lipopolysaccharide biosynthesis protein [Aurantiacibacter marinus]|uniref:lipopolysaccharide biosynthesis protein n=1 Tax=Aurantiacibacter marinus TaxID=874156 RepID=UPI000A7B8329|nr:lipopolysaccharide biosynthesis protein [Aurantiacibacter marinus]